MWTRGLFIPLIVVLIFSGMEAKAVPDSEQYGQFASQSLPFISFKFPNFVGWKAEVHESEVLYFPRGEGDSVLLVRIPVKIRVSGLIKDDRTEEWRRWWTAHAKRNHSGIFIAITRRERETVLTIDHNGSYFEITHDNLEESGFSGGKISPIIFQTLRFVNKEPRR